MGWDHSPSCCFLQRWAKKLKFCHCAWLVARFLVIFCCYAAAHCCEYRCIITHSERPRRHTAGRSKSPIRVIIRGVPRHRERGWGADKTGRDRKWKKMCSEWRDEDNSTKRCLFCRRFLKSPPSPFTVENVVRALDLPSAGGRFNSASDSLRPWRYINLLTYLLTLGRSLF